MELKSVDDVNALTEYKKLEKIESLENKIKRLKYIPVLCGTLLLANVLWLTFSGSQTIESGVLILFAVFIAIVGHSNVQRSDLLQELFEIKYGLKSV